MVTRIVRSQEETRALSTYSKLMRAADSLLVRLQHGGTMGALTVTQFGTLELLLHKGPLPQHEICRKLLKSGGNITLVVDNLVKKGLVIRRRSTTDRRVVMVRLSAKGRQLIEELFPGHARAIAREFSILTAEEQATLGRFCRKLGRQDEVLPDNS
ncbi:MAG: MarR family transcriptional regulator [Acidobacteria bacterium]|nr:MarR family transcriptional regulator [Acidobacteriota bacterium]